MECDALHSAQTGLIVFDSFRVICSPYHTTDNKNISFISAISYFSVFALLLNLFLSFNCAVGNDAIESRKNLIHSKIFSINHTIQGDQLRAFLLQHFA